MLNIFVVDGQLEPVGGGVGQNKTSFNPEKVLADL